MRNFFKGSGRSDDTYSSIILTLSTHSSNLFIYFHSSRDLSYEDIEERVWRSLFSVDGERMTIPYHSMEPQTLTYTGSQHYQPPPPPPPPPVSYTSNTLSLPAPSPRSIYSSLSEATNGFFYNHKQETAAAAAASSAIRKSLSNSDHQQQQPSHHPASHHQSFQSFQNFSQSPAAGQLIGCIVYCILYTVYSNKVLGPFSFGPPKSIISP